MLLFLFRRGRYLGWRFGNFLSYRLKLQIGYGIIGGINRKFWEVLLNEFYQNVAGRS